MIKKINDYQKLPINNKLFLCYNTTVHKEVGIMELNDSIVSILDKIRIDAEDIVGIIDFGIKPMIKETEQEEFELSAEKLNKFH